jgi:hypothetical protein
MSKCKDLLGRKERKKDNNREVQFDFSFLFTSFFSLVFPTSKKVESIIFQRGKKITENLQHCIIKKRT